MKKIVVSQNSKERIDKDLANILEISRAEISRMIEKGFILVNNHSCKGSYKLKENDVIEIKDGYFKETTFAAVKMDLNIVFEDKDLMVINKPSGLVVHPGSGNKTNTLVNGLLDYTNNLSDINGEMRPGIVHRIDKDTSGLLLVAKNNKTHELLATAFKNKNIRREYLALVNGVIVHDRATIDAPIGRDKLDRKKMTVTNENAKEAVTHLKVLKRYKNHTLISLRLETGRTHQIRVHLKYIGYTIYNDPVYANKSEGDFGQFLHSWKIDFKHPITNEELHFVCEVPKAFQEYLKILNKEI